MKWVFAATLGSKNWLVRNQDNVRPHLKICMFPLGRPTHPSKTGNKKKLLLEIQMKTFESAGFSMSRLAEGKHTYF